MHRMRIETPAMRCGRCTATRCAAHALPAMMRCESCERDWQAGTARDSARGEAADVRAADRRARAGGALFLVLLPIKASSARSWRGDHHRHVSRARDGDRRRHRRLPADRSQLARACSSASAPAPCHAPASAAPSLEKSKIRCPRSEPRFRASVSAAATVTACGYPLPLLLRSPRRARRNPLPDLADDHLGQQRQLLLALRRRRRRRISRIRSIQPHRRERRHARKQPLRSRLIGTADNVARTASSTSEGAAASTIDVSYCPA